MSGDKRTILLVIEEDAARNQIRRVLQGGGNRILPAKNHDDAIAIYRRQGAEVDLLLTEVALPGLSGCDLAIALRQQNPSLRVLLTSGYTGAEVLKFFGIQHTDLHFLQKPFRPEELLERVASMFRQFGSASA
jgi:CheY-like chemotaxis protein